MNTKRLLKAKVDDISQETISSKSKKSVQLANTSPVSAMKDTEENELMTTDKKVIDQIGQLTRNLHDSLRELGYDKRLESIAAEVPEAQDKLSYVATKTEQAAERTLNATEIAMPIQEKLSADATQLSAQWKQALETQQNNPDTEIFKTLLIDTLHYLDKIPEQTNATNTQLLEIMMAQDFQDLTGQVIKKVTHMVQSLEKDLIDLLLANVPTKKNSTTDEGLMNGPVTNPEKRNDIVCSQDQVDDLLASLGF
jgi:chemotaxis protein CheZ